MANGSGKSDVGARVRGARKRLGLTQDQLAELCGVSREFISRLENGKQGSKASILVNIADTLGIDPMLLLRGVIIPPQDDFMVKETEDILRRLMPSKRLIVFRLAEALWEDEGPPEKR